MPPPRLTPILTQPPRVLTHLSRRYLATSTSIPPSQHPTSPPPNPAFQVFNRNTKRLQRDRSALSPDVSRRVDYLKNEVAERLVERLMDIKRDFPTVLDVGAGACHIARALALYTPPSTSPSTSFKTKKVQNLLCTDISSRLLHRDQHLPPFSPAHSNLSNLHLLPSLDEEHLHPAHPSLPSSPSPFAPPYNAILSSLSLHWINNLPSVLSTLPRLLQPDSPFIAAMLGGDTLFELRTSLQLAELERRGGVTPRMSPLADTRDIASLLTQAGFKMLTVDIDDIVVTYPDIFALMTDLQYMGEGNAVLGREMGAVRRDVLMAAEGIYRELHGEEVSKKEVEELRKDGVEVVGGKVLPATFRVIYMIGWTEGPNQPKPLRRGSGQLSIKEVLEEGGKSGKK